jgi:hypothetical protein
VAEVVVSTAIIGNEVHGGVLRDVFGVLGYEICTVTGIGRKRAPICV